jgi:cyclophilin family peptidyl-prolyl cis-trans isomerase
VSSRARKRQRHKQLRRQKIEAEVRAYKARRRRSLAIRLGIVLSVVGVVAALVLNARSPEEPEAEAQTCSTRRPELAETERSFPQPPTLAIDQAKTYIAEMETSCGTMTITLADDTSPQTVNSFVFLTRQRFFDGLPFHRVTTYAVQSGDPKGDGSGGPGYQVAEPPPPEFTYVKGVVAMAKAENDPPGTSGSQFFIVPDAQEAQLAGLNGIPQKPALYAVLGTVTKGMDALDKLGAVETFTPPNKREKSTPRTPIYIVKVEITES